MALAPLQLLLLLGGAPRSHAATVIRAGPCLLVLLEKLAHLWQSPVGVGEVLGDAASGLRLGESSLEPGGNVIREVARDKLLDPLGDASVPAIDKIGDVLQGISQYILQLHTK